VKPWLALGWTPGALTGWGTFGANFARSLADAGYDVRLPAGLDPSGVAPLDRPALQALVKPMDETAEGWLFAPIGNSIEARMDLPSHVKVAAFCVFEDSGALTPEAVERLKAYDALLAPSTWVQGLLQAKGLPSQLFHQGYDDRTYFPGPR
jgi:hypothetical protein